MIIDKGILTIIGGFCIHLACGTIYCFGLLNSFIISYLYLHDDEIVHDDGFFLLPIGIISMKGCVIFGGLSEFYFGTRVTLIIGMVCVSLSYLLMFIVKSLVFFNLCMIFFGFGIGLCVS